MAALAMWTSDPPQYPELTDEEREEVIQKARQQKGQALYSRAYAKRSKGVREFPQFDAKTFRDWIKQRGDAKAIDCKWKSGQFDIDADNKNVLKILALYFTRDKRFEELNSSYSLFKGIYLVGPTGVGKTKLMELCDINPHGSYSRHDCQVIAGEYEDKKTGGQRVIDLYSANTESSNPDSTFGHLYLGRFFDDLGQEDMSRHFGKDKNVMAAIIENRYRHGNYHLTHFTSNHTINDLDDLYGSRVPDRLREMCNLIEYPSTAKSRR